MRSSRRTHHDGVVMTAGERPGLQLSSPRTDRITRTPRDVTTYSVSNAERVRTYVHTTDSRTVAVSYLLRTSLPS